MIRIEIPFLPDSVLSIWSSICPEPVCKKRAEEFARVLWEFPPYPSVGKCLKYGAALDKIVFQWTKEKADIQPFVYEISERAPMTILEIEEDENGKE